MSLTVDEVDFYIFEEPLNLHKIVAEAVVQKCSVKKVFLNISQNLQKTPVLSSWKRLWPQSCNYIKKETVAQVFSCKEFIQLQTQKAYERANNYFLRSTSVLCSSAVFVQIKHTFIGMCSLFGWFNLQILNLC